MFLDTSTVTLPEYYWTIQGPDISRAFQVVQGLVVVQAATNMTLVIPAGGAWPGIEQLSPTLRAHLEPKSSTQAPDTVFSYGLDEADQPAAQALVLVQALTSLGTVSERLALAKRLQIPVRNMNRRTCASVLGTTRVHLSKVLNELRDEADPVAATEAGKSACYERSGARPIGRY